MYQRGFTHCHGYRRLSGRQQLQRCHLQQPTIRRNRRGHASAQGLQYRGQFRRFDRFRQINIRTGFITFLAVYAAYSGRQHHYAYLRQSLAQTFGYRQTVFIRQI